MRKKRRVYLKDGIANTKGEGELIGFLDGLGIINPYMEHKVDKETTIIVPVSKDYADFVDRRNRKKVENKIACDTDIN